MELTVRRGASSSQATQPPRPWPAAVGRLAALLPWPWTTISSGSLALPCYIPRIWRGPRQPYQVQAAVSRPHALERGAMQCARRKLCSSSCRRCPPPLLGGACGGHPHALCTRATTLALGYIAHHDYRRGWFEYGTDIRREWGTTMCAATASK